MLYGMAPRRPGVAANKNNSETTSSTELERLETSSKKLAGAEQLCVTLKSFLLLLLVMGLVLTIRFGALKYRDAETERALILSQLEDRILKIEANTPIFVDRRLDRMQKMIETDVGELVNQVNKRIQENAISAEKNWEQVDELLGDVNTTNSVRFEKLIDGLNKAEYTLKAYAKDLVINEIEKHAADGLGRTDYAVNAVVVKHSETYYTPSHRHRSLWNKNKVDDNARRMFSPSFGEPFQCFALKGSRGFVEFQLWENIIVEAVTLEHLAKSVAISRLSSAPRDCRIFGWLEQDGSKSARLLAEFSYDLEMKSNVQTFNVSDPATSSLVNMVRFEFESNHGKDYTCIYRLRVHGRPVDSSL